MEPKIIESKHEYIDKIDNTVLEGFFLLICHAFGGLGNFEEEKCRELARLGFVSFAIDLYGKGKRGQTIEENMSLLKPFLEDRTSLLRRRLLYGLETLKLESSIAVIGFCFGGLCALDLARINVGIKIAVSFHGSFKPLPDQSEPEKELPIKANILICHGDADTHISHEQVLSFYNSLKSILKFMGIMAEMRARKSDWQFIIYGNAKHGFTDKRLEGSTREGVGYNKEADNRSWSAMLALFKEKFGIP